MVIGIIEYGKVNIMIYNVKDINPATVIITNVNSMANKIY